MRTRTGVTAAELRRFFLEAADLIQRYGWWNCGLGDRSIGFCVLGALDEAYNRLDPTYGTRNIAVAWLEHLVTFDGPIHKWNDVQGNRVLVIDYLLRGAETSELAVERLRDHDWK